jgi:site-specific recombinase XerD
MQDREREHAGDRWVGTGLVFVSAYGAPLSAGAVRRSFKRVAAKAGLGSADWTPRELRHSFVSLLSDNGVSLEDIADLCGHSGTTVTEKPEFRSSWAHERDRIGVVAGQRVAASGIGPESPKM